MTQLAAPSPALSNLTKLLAVPPPSSMSYSTHLPLLSSIRVHKWEEQSIKRQEIMFSYQIYKQLCKARNEEVCIKMHLKNPLTFIFTAVFFFIDITRDAIKLLTCF